MLSHDGSGALRIPAPTRPTAEQVIKLTDKVCADLLDEEYAGLARQVVAKLARKRPSPLQSGRAVAVRPRRDVGRRRSVGARAGQLIRDMLKMTWATPEFLRVERIDDNPVIWFAGVNGVPFDVCCPSRSRWRRTLRESSRMSRAWGAMARPPPLRPSGHDSSHRESRLPLWVQLD